MSTSKISLETVAAELYVVLRELKNQTQDTLIVESANRAMKMYEKFKRTQEDKHPLLPGYESLSSDQKTKQAAFDVSLFEYMDKYVSS